MSSSNEAYQHLPKQYSYHAENSKRQSSRDDSTLVEEPEEERPRVPLTIRANKDCRSNVPPRRTIVICLDGTGDQFDNDNSNVVNFVACLKKDDPSQLTYYQAGIGTYDGHHGLKSGFSAAFDMAIGSGLGIHIKDAYQFLMQNYREGDKICLLGFSRGSYTVRCLAGMLHKVGLLPAHNKAQLSFAYDFYKDDTEEGWKMSRDFKKTFCTEVFVYFIGVWDCVASVGFIPRKLPFSKTPTNNIKYFRHAMALDERRAKFKICQWQHQDPNADPRTIRNAPKTKAKSYLRPGRLRRKFNTWFGTQSGGQSTIDRTPLSSSTEPTHESEEKHQIPSKYKLDSDNNSAIGNTTTDALEVWFAGAHADVGGGAVHNDSRHMLSRIPLRWMIRQCFECDTGIIFGTTALVNAGIDIPTVWPIYKALEEPVVDPLSDTIERYRAGVLPALRRRSTALRVESTGQGAEEKVFCTDIFCQHEKHQLEANLLREQVEDYFDAMAPINDQLKQAKGWWILEFWPVKVRVQKKGSEEWEKLVRLNMGRFRAIREAEPKIHWTVQKRMNDKNYQIRNRASEDTTWQTVV